MAAAIDGREGRPRPLGQRLHAGRLEHDLLQRLRPSALWTAEHALHHLDHAPRETERCPAVQDVGRRKLVRHHEQRHVAHDLARWRHLDDVTEQLVGCRVRFAELRPPALQAKTLGLLAQVRVLAARHLVLIDVGAWRLEPLFERVVQLAEAAQ